MKKKQFFVSAILCLPLLACQQDDKLSTASGQTVIVSPSDPHYIAINYWATWCVSCKREVKSMNQISKQFPSQLILLGVNFSGKRGKALQQAIDQLDIHYPVVVSDVATKWHLPVPQVLPATYLLSPSHRLIKTFYGEDTAVQLRNYLVAHASK